MRRRFTKEYKVEAVRLATVGDKSLAQLGLRPDELREWKRQFSAAGSPAEAFPGNGRTGGAEEELQRLRREVEQLKQERDFLTKQRRTSRGVRAEVRLHRSAPRRVQSGADVPRAGGEALGLLRVAHERGERAAGANTELVAQIEEVHAWSRRTYGSPRMHWGLGARGIACGRHRLARLMREHGIRPKQKRRFRVTTDSSHGRPVAENHLCRQLQVEKPNTVWAGDIT
jgi:transposase-like protein